MIKTATKLAGLVATTGMFLVLVMGATVTNTGSEQGCGRQWPLCHGKLIPQMAVKTAIEFSHRAVVGLETILILIFAAGALYLYRRRRDVQVLCAFMVGTLFLQAGLGAWAVLYPQEPAILALHFGVSLVAFASVLLATIFVFQADGPSPGIHVVSRNIRWGIWATAAFSYIVVYLGAYVRHANATSACSDWPLCHGTTVPVLQGNVATVFAHRLGALVLTVAILTLTMWTAEIRKERPDLFRASSIALALVVLQALSGAIVVWTKVDLFSALTHAGLVGLMFGALAYLSVAVTGQRVPVEHRAVSSQRVAGDAEAVGASR